jgi:hypothetical protein
MKQRRQGGFTLLETAIAIGVGLLGAIAALKLGGEASLRAKVAAEVQDIDRLLVQITRTYSAYGGPTPYAALTAANVLARSLVPNTLNRGGVIQGRWGPYTLTSGNLAGGAAGTAAQVLLNSIPPPVCRLLAPALLPFVDEMDVGANNNVKSAANPNPAPDTVATACNVGAGIPLLGIRLRKS